MSDIDALQLVDQIYRSSYEAVVYVGREQYMALRKANCNGRLIVHKHPSNPDTPETVMGRELVEVRALNYFRIHRS